MSGDPTEICRAISRYAALLRKRFNKRFAGRPDCFRLAHTAEQIAEALEEAVKKELRIAVQSGGHCLEGFVSDPDVRVVIDTSPLSAVYFDEKTRAFAVEAGAPLGEAWRKLFLGWGVMLPAGQSPDIGVGGHVLGGGFGFFHRQYGLAVDHLYAVDIVVVDESGRARSVRATREPSDPNHELWWAHTGCGGGNFGIVTRYYFRSPGASDADPMSMLPKAPERLTTFKAIWEWKDLDEASFKTIVGNFGEWCERNGDPESPSARLFSVLTTGRPVQGELIVRGVVTGDDAEPTIDAHLGALGTNAGPPRTKSVQRHTWLEFALNPLPDLFMTGPGGVAASQALLKVKDAILKKRHTDRQLAVAYDYLARKSPDVAGGSMGLATYGGRVNTVAPDATACAQRDSVMITSYGVGWGKPEEQAASLAWVREFYRNLFAETGGVPLPGDVADGALINHPDTDLADPAWNRSGASFGAIYYKDNYPRLQRVKKQWDPLNVFRHALSIRSY